MTVFLVSYTQNGAKTAAQIAAGLRAQGHRCRCFAQPGRCPPDAQPLTQSAVSWAEAGFREADALVFCCAAGIAVRAIAPWVKSKAEDPAVLVADELGRFVVPLLSGHLGGANALALAIAKQRGATPVVTTATDLNGVFAVDVFAAQNHLQIEDPGLAREISAALLAGETVGFRADLPCAGALPAGLTRAEAALGICVTEQPDSASFPRTLRLLPVRYAAGMGCRRGKSAEELEAFLLRQLAAAGVAVRALRCIASIDRKREEPGLVQLCKKYGLPLQTYSAVQLSAAPGRFSGSAFVRAQTGVDSVCERAAVLAGGRLIRRKAAENGMTCALARGEEAIWFE